MNDEDLTLKIPIPSTVRQKAKQFAAAQPTPEKAARVYRQTLAVFAAMEYLQNWLGYDVPQEESLNPVTRTLSDSANIWIAGIGRIECLVAKPDAETCPLPPAAQEGRIGYLVVEMAKNETEAKQVRLLGFAPMFDPEDVPDEVELEELESLDEMVDYFDRLERGADELKKILFHPESNPESNPEPDEHQQLMLVAMLERIYRQEKPNRWGIKAARVLLSSREAVLQEQAEAVMQRLDKLWTLVPTDRAIISIPKGYLRSGKTPKLELFPLKAETCGLDRAMSVILERQGDVSVIHKKELLGSLNLPKSATQMKRVFARTQTCDMNRTISVIRERQGDVSVIHKKELLRNLPKLVM